MEVQKILHFIWVGQIAMPDDRIENMKQFMRENPDFQVRLWVDNQGTPAGVNDKYKEAFADMGQKPILSDITELSVVTPEVRYEIDKLRPNYGSASDLLRYNILEHMGGMYVDSDVQSSGVPLSRARSTANVPIWDHDSDEYHCFFVANPSGRFNNANDVIACKPGDPTIASLNRAAHDNYRDYRSFTDIEQNPHWYKSHEHGLMQQHLYSGALPSFQGRATLTKTGPGCVATLLGPQGGEALMREADVRQPLGVSAHSWLSRVRRCASLNDALDRAMNEVQFEVAHLHCLTLESHVANILKSIENTEQNITADQVAVHLIQRIEAAYENQRLGEQINHVQLTFSSPAVEQFYERHDLKLKTNLFPYTEADVPNVETALASAHQPSVQWARQDGGDARDLSEENTRRFITAKEHFVVRLLPFYSREINRLSLVNPESSEQLVLRCIDVLQNSYTRKRDRIELVAQFFDQLTNEVQLNGGLKVAAEKQASQFAKDHGFASVRGLIKDTSKQRMKATLHSMYN